MNTPGRDCGGCPRLVQLREQVRTQEPDWHNAPVASFGSLDAELLIVGLAPGRGGANRTGRPFTGDYAGDLLYQTIEKFGLSEGRYGAGPDDGLRLRNCRITNAVRCLPPENKPVGAEIKECGAYLAEEIGAMGHLRVLLALGVVAHGAVLTVLGQRKSLFKFSHGAQHQLPSGLVLADSYHCSRYNTNTRRLTVDMFESVFEGLAGLLPRS
ncbi:MAG: uracil-DNA glycosylase [Rhodospirillaceae bacterium]|jgi:uracil-DNA glycosylase family 4|nr:uracil-DNA glycosylase [Rhodospirillaceae bacterium]MBT3886108.1 uracil-DNA glycosylase [Rhodospirillaceae bacterium]MBT4118655.1 uracil-DNA glycosylase [Rhodospirillaceae bacterium]MBT4672527.1 uracil-DNA glycosylase [Rhodospirillaceae bacterium]MBT4748674.1 uracil-DNA glycosylase [Rhodospirillaceae bacterium]